MGKYVSVRQNSTSDCGAACVATIAKYYNKSINVGKIREITKTDSNGTTVAGLMKAFKFLKFDAKAVRIEKNSLLSKFTLPCVAHVKKPDGSLHFVIVYKITRKTVTISDPEFGIVKYKLNEFAEMFLETLIIVLPSNDFEKGNDQSTLIIRFVQILTKHKTLFIFIFLASVVITLFGFISSFFMKYLIDEILVNQLINTLTVFFVGMIVFNVFQVLLSFARSHLCCFYLKSWTLRY